MTPSGPELTVVLPVYNEGEIIGEVLEDWTGELERLHIDFEIHAYNDGSRDNTLEILKTYEASNKNIIVHDKSNTGHGPTILLGYRENSNAEWVFQVDSDNEITTEFFAEFWERRKEFDFLIGRRVERQSPLSRRFMTSAARIIVTVLYGEGIFDVNCPYRLMRGQLLKELISEIPPSLFAPNVILSGLVCMNNYRILEIPVVHSQRATGKVSIQKVKLLKAAARALGQTILFRLRI
jgi:glycosyltransferase involved in cell wall biosynthesis